MGELLGSLQNSGLLVSGAVFVSAVALFLFAALLLMPALETRRRLTESLLTEGIAIDDSQNDGRQPVIVFRSRANNGTNLRHIEVFQFAVDGIHHQSLCHSIDKHRRAIGELQRVTGDHFASVQGGRFVSPAVSEALGWLQSQGVAGIGQSSWGPTGFGIIGEEEHARSLARAAQLRWKDRLEFIVCEARNRGGEVEVAYAMRSSAGR